MGRAGGGQGMQGGKGQQQGVGGGGVGGDVAAQRQQQQGPVTVAPAMARDAACPVCGLAFPARMTNAEVNQHVDACIAALAD